MGKLSKKNNTEVAAAPLKKGKMDTEETLKKDVSAKKQKLEAAVPKLEKKNKKSKKSSKTPPPKKAESSSSEDDSSESEVEALAKVTLPAKRKPVAGKKDVLETPKGKVENSVENDDDNSDVSDDEPQNKKLKTPEESNMEEDDEESSEDEAAKDDKDELSTPAESTTLYVGNLPFDISEAAIAEFFKDVGKVIEIRRGKRANGTSRPFGHVEFATPEEAQKALKLNGQDLSGRAVKLDLAKARVERSVDTQSGNSSKKGGTGSKPTVYVRGFDKTADVDQIQSSLQEHFASCGDISRITLPTDRETGVIKGFAYVDFKNEEALKNAVKLSGSKLEGYSLAVEAVKPRSDGDRSGGGRGRGGGRFGGRGGGRGSGRGRDGGRGRGRGRTSS